MTSGILTAAILTVSDRVSRNEAQDLSGPALSNKLTEKGYQIVKTDVVPDDIPAIQKVVTEWSRMGSGIDLVVTTGGTGFNPRDVTPEAITPLISKPCPGIVTTMLTKSLQVTPFAMLSRPVAGIRHESLIITLPGSPKGAIENLEFILPALKHGIELVKGSRGDKVHTAMQESNSKGHQHHGHRCAHHGPSEDTNAIDSTTTSSSSSSIAKRLRHSPYPMLSVPEAKSLIAKHTRRLPTLRKPVTQELVGHILSQDVFARDPFPSFRASIMDGYAVMASDGVGVFPVVSSSIAGPGAEEGFVLSPGQVVRVTTGAPVPNGATGVVKVEDTRLVETSEDGKEEKKIEILVAVKNGANIREIGSDLAAGELLLAKNDMITSVGGELGILVSAGVKEVEVYAKPKIALISTGNEVVDLMKVGPDAKLKYGEIWDTNRPSLLVALQKVGFESVDYGIVNDDADLLERTIKKALSECDVLITTGGVSMGELDLLKPVLTEKCGAQIQFGRVNMKPGKPTTFAITPKEGQLVFSLPGNPSSALVTFYLFVLPALVAMAGRSEGHGIPIMKAAIQQDYTLLDSRPEYVRGRIVLDGYEGTQPPKVYPTEGSQRSSRIKSFRGANALILVDRGSVRVGDLVDVMLLE